MAYVKADNKDLFKVNHRKGDKFTLNELWRVDKLLFRVNVVFGDGSVQLARVMK